MRLGRCLSCRPSASRCRAGWPSRTTGDDCRSPHPRCRLARARGAPPGSAVASPGHHEQAREGQESLAVGTRRIGQTRCGVGTRRERASAVRASADRDMASTRSCAATARSLQRRPSDGSRWCATHRPRRAAPAGRSSAVLAGWGPAVGRRCGSTPRRPQRLQCRASAGAKVRPGCRASARRAHRPVPVPRAGAASAVRGRAPIAAMHSRKPGPRAPSATIRRYHIARRRPAAGVGGPLPASPASCRCRRCAPSESVRRATRWSFPARNRGRPHVAVKRCSPVPAVRPPGGCARPRSGRRGRDPSRSSRVVREAFDPAVGMAGEAAAARAPCTGASSGQGQPPNCGAPVVGEGLLDLCAVFITNGPYCATGSPIGRPCSSRSSLVSRPVDQFDVGCIAPQLDGGMLADASGRRRSSASPSKK